MTDDATPTDRAYSMRLGQAIRHLHAFAATFNNDEIVDEESDLTADDLYVLLEAAERVHSASRED